MSALKTAVGIDVASRLSKMRRARGLSIFCLTDGAPNQEPGSSCQAS